MHISDTFTNQFKGFGIVKKIQSLFVGLSCLLSKQFDDASVFALKEDRVCLHRLQCDGFNKLKITVNHLLGGDAELMVGLLPTKLIQSLLAGVDALKIKVNGIEDVVVGNATLNDVVLLMRQALATGCHIVKPFTIVSREKLAIDIRCLFSKLKDIHNGWLSSANEALAIATSLLFQGGKTEAHTKWMCDRISCCFQNPFLVHQIDQVFNDVFARESMQYIVARHNVVGDDIALGHLAINVLGTHLQSVGYAAHAEDNEVKYLKVHNLLF